MGVHIRQGDYARHLGGRYFYSLEQYRACLDAVADHLGAVTFLITSDAELDPATFAPHQVTISRGRAIEDLHTLAACDYVMGPPSTFSTWAAYWGDRPLWRIEDPEQCPAFDAYLPAGEREIVRVEDVRASVAFPAVTAAR